MTWVQGDISPTSSRKIVPAWAVSNIPFLSETAPVKEPLTWPKSSLSRRFSGRAAQLIETKARSCRRLLAWIARAASSLPVPLSPVIRTVESVEATFSIRSKTSCIGRLLPIMFSKLVSVPERLLEEHVFLAEPPVLEAVGHEDLELLDVEGLDDVIHGPQPEGLDGLLDAAVGRDHDDRDGGLLLLEPRRTSIPSTWGILMSLIRRSIVLLLDVLEDARACRDWS